MAKEHEKMLDGCGHFTGDAAKALLDEMEGRLAGYTASLDGTAVASLKQILQDAPGKPAELVLCEATRALTHAAAEMLSDSPRALRSAAITADMRGDGGAHVFVLAQACAYLRASHATLIAAEDQLRRFIEQSTAPKAPDPETVS